MKSLCDEICLWQVIKKRDIWMDDEEEKPAGVVAYLPYVRILRVVSDKVRRSIARFYQMMIRLEGAIYILSVFLTLKVSYHSGKLRGVILARRMQGP